MEPSLSSFSRALKLRASASGLSTAACTTLNSAVPTTIIRRSMTTSSPAFQPAPATPSSSGSSYVPHASQSRINGLPPRSKPQLTTFFTGKPTYEYSILELEKAIHEISQDLRKAHILPLPKELEVIPPRVAWIHASDMAAQLATPLRTSQYRRVASLLNELALLREIARRSGEPESLSKAQEALQRYERTNALSTKSASLEGAMDGSGASSGNQRPQFSKTEDGFIDEFGRSFTKGRRKESSARVWMIKTKEAAALFQQPTTGSTSTSKATLSSSSPSSSADVADPSSLVPTTEVLINSLPIHAHFPRSTDRELILRPLRLTGLLGAFNIFALTTGGGTTGQAGAVALAVARAVAVHRPDLRDVLQKDGMLIRDPRMVERKKTGLAKARKRYTWVKR